MFMFTSVVGVVGSWKSRRSRDAGKS